MEVKGFNEGVYVPHYKESTQNKPIKIISIPEEIVLPLRQHTGAPCTPLVQKGDKVSAGDLIADTDAFVSAKIHASVSGTVEAIESRPYFTRTQVESIVIKPHKERLDEEAIKKEESKWHKNEVNIAELTDEEILEKVKNAGVVGMGGAAFPTHIKLSPPEHVDTIIINACECEPFLTCDHQSMLESPDALLEGTKIIKEIVKASEVYIGIEANKEDAAGILEEKAKGYGFEVVILDTKYPQGAEKQLIKSVVDREVPPRKLPFNVGVIVQNVNTAISVYEAVKFDKPLIERVLTVSGDGINDPCNVKARLGTKVAHIIQECGGVKASALEDAVLDTSEVRYPVTSETKIAGKVIIGGPMTGEAQESLDVPVIKGTTGILVFTPEMLHETHHYACVRCGKCISTCPMLLYPNYIGIYAETGRYELASKWGALDCFECGACTYVCPSLRPNVRFAREVKKRTNG